MGGGASADEVLPWASDVAPLNISVCRVISVSGSRSAGSICESIIICIIIYMLAKRFGGDRSSAYINGMLGTLAKRLGQADKE